MKQQLSEMTTEVKEMGGDLVRGLPENASFHLRIVNRNNRLDAMAVIFQKLWRYFGRSEPYPKLLDDWIGAMHKIPTITDWLRRSACRQGAFQALSLVAMHHPRLKIPDTTYGFPLHNGVLDMDARDRAQTKVRPYATRVARDINLSFIMPSRVPTEDRDVTPHRDFARAHPFAAVLAGNLTTYPDEYDQWDLEEYAPNPPANDATR